MRGRGGASHDDAEASKFFLLFCLSRPPVSTRIKPCGLRKVFELEHTVATTSTVLWVRGVTMSILLISSVEQLWHIGRHSICLWEVRAVDPCPRVSLSLFMFISIINVLHKKSLFFQETPHRTIM